MTKQDKKNQIDIVTMIHDLRAPLATIKEGVSQLIDELDGPINENQKQTLKIVQRNIEKLIQLMG